MVPGGSAVPAGPAVPVSRSLFRPFDSSVPAAAPVAPVPQGASVLASAPSVVAAPSRVPPHAPPGSLPPSLGAFCVALDELPEDDPQDAIPRDPDPAFATGVSDSIRS